MLCLYKPLMSAVKHAVCFELYFLPGWTNGVLRAHAHARTRTETEQWLDPEQTS